MMTVPKGLWYCEFNTDPNAEVCMPTPNVPLRSIPIKQSGIASKMSAQQVEDICRAFPKLKESGVEQEVLFPSGWVASFKKRKRGEGGDVYVSKPGEPTLRSALDVRRRFGLITHNAAGDAEDTRAATDAKKLESLNASAEASNVQMDGELS